jgi:hypothetical protein
MRKKPSKFVSYNSLIMNTNINSKQVRKKQMFFPQFNGCAVHGK